MHFAASQAQPSRESAPAVESLSCPLCNGQLIALRGAYRCARCSFILCAGCDASPAGGPEPGD